MEREPGEFERREGQPFDDGEDNELDRLLADLSVQERAEIDAAIAEAEADIAAGRVVPHEQVAAWLQTWGTPEYKPMPDEWLR